MMSRKLLRQVERGLWGMTAACGVATGAVVVHARTHGHQRTLVPPPIAEDVMMYDRDILAREADRVIANDLFRSERRPSHVAFGTAPAAVLPTPSPPPRPQLTVEGIAGGPPWRAVLHGVPNHEGSVVVAPGDTLSGLWVRSIRRDTVVVQGRDTLWTLTVKY
jgi:hypothetical protein